MISAIVIEYTPKGKGKRIFMVRNNGLTRIYPYSPKNAALIILSTENWRVREFTGNTTLTRP